MLYTAQNGAAIAAAWHVDQAASAVYFMLHALQHKGSDGAGIAAADGQQLCAVKNTGLLSEIFKPERLEELPGSLAVGQVRMASESDVFKENLQPIRVRAHQGDFALVCEGMISNAPSLREAMEKEGLIFQGTSDGEIIAHLIQIAPGTLQEKIDRACQMLKGAFNMVLMTKNTMYLYRSSDGIHSLYLARYQNGYLAASETAAFSLFEGTEVREVLPGEMVILGKDGYSSRQRSLPLSHPCSMQCVYYGKEDSLFEGCSIHRLRQKAGTLLARKETETADMVIGVPDTAMPAAYAFARAAGLPYEIGLIKNRYIGSTFVRPTQQQRLQGMRVRLNAISSIVRGKRIFLVDDSVQKGDTALRLCELLREAGAAEIHLRIASPCIRHSCLYGVEYIPENQLAAARYSTEEMKELFHADSLRFLDEEDFASLLPEGACRACMNGSYPADPADYAFSVQTGSPNWQE